jgi:hypothetical protein
MNYFKTPKGTQLPFLNLKGKDYLQVAHRLVWFREEHPTWTIFTEIKQHDEIEAVMCAKILDETGRVLATAHKQQSAKGFAAYIEKAEAGAVGRALAFLGYGTTHAQELEEDESTPMDQLPDSPIARKPMADKIKEAFPSAKVTGYVCTFGKYKGKDLSKEKREDLDNYCQYLQNSAKEQGKPLSKPIQEFINAVKSLDGDIPPF